MSSGPLLFVGATKLRFWVQTSVLCSGDNRGGQRLLPRPAPPPSSLQSKPAQVNTPPGKQEHSVKNDGSNNNNSVVPQPPPQHKISAVDSGVMRWSYQEVHAGTGGFSPSLQVGEGGFGVVYRATLRNTDCAVKRLKKVSQSECRLQLTVT